MVADSSYGVEIVDDGDGSGGYEIKESFDGPVPGDAPEEGRGNGGGERGGGSRRTMGFFGRSFRGSANRSFDPSMDGWNGESLPPWGTSSLEETASEDESFNTSTRRETNGAINGSAKRSISSSKKKSSSRAAREERQRRTRRRNIAAFILALCLVGIAWFLVYYFVSGRGASVRRSKSTTMAPTLSPSPSASPSAVPSASPSEAPAMATDSPSHSPSGGPTSSPTLSFAPTAVADIVDPVQLVALTERDLRALIANDPPMGAKFVRLGFHDCVGFCDGCVDMTFHDNFGLELPIEALAPLVALYERPEAGYSRADIWALAALVAADVAQERSETKVDFKMQFVGRKNCEVRFDGQCFDEDGVTLRDCSATLGPFHHLPLADTTTADLFHFFNNEFGFTDQETVAIMGAHTLGALHREFSGINGNNGWVRDNLLLDNDYYHEIVGGDSLDDSLENLIEDAPPWLRVLEDNSDLEGFSDKAIWEAFPPSFENPDEVERIVMLNADVALVRELDETNLMSDGKVTCAFIGAVGGLTPTCPHAERSLMFAAEYKFDNDLWLNDFRNVYHKMLNHGCSDLACNNDDGGICACIL